MRFYENLIKHLTNVEIYDQKCKPKISNNYDFYALPQTKL